MECDIHPCQVCGKACVDFLEIRQIRHCINCVVDVANKQLKKLEEKIERLEKSQKRKMPRGTKWDGEKYVEPDPSYKS